MWIFFQKKGGGGQDYTKHMGTSDAATHHHTTPQGAYPAPLHAPSSSFRWTTGQMQRKQISGWITLGHRHASLSGDGSGGVRREIDWSMTHWINCTPMLDGMSQGRWSTWNDADLINQNL